MKAIASIPAPYRRRSLWLPAGVDDQAFGLVCRVEQRLALGQRNGSVRIAMQKQDRGGKLADQIGRGPTLVWQQQAGGEYRVMMRRDFAHPVERRLEDQCGGFAPSG